MRQIYAACLASYNHGILHGEWIDATQDPDSIGHEIELMLKASPIPGAEEFAIHDYEDFGGIQLGEYESLEELHLIALALDDFPAVVVRHFHGEVDAEDLYETCQDRYIGKVEEEAGPEENAYAAYILAEEDHFWDELPKQYRSHMRAIAISEAEERLICGETALYEGAGTWHFVRDY
ncbi:antirestriction protein ArdA [Streptomyces sp. NBC_01216]|uniref:antirestriction protein ArdA n=1 Tax=Streptomyces sp. NBC_01216 TaxID=2903778 RepID=UPI002E108D8C|nr:antirestriction protein ArdA [Streptomyces sp. NBC_01216]